PSSAVSALLKPPADFRDHSLLDITLLDLSEARIARPEGDLRFHRRDEEWWIESPVEDLAEGSTVQSLLSGITGLRAESFVDEDQIAARKTPAANAQAGASPPGTGPASGQSGARSPGQAAPAAAGN